MNKLLTLLAILALAGCGGPTGVGGVIPEGWTQVDGGYQLSGEGERGNVFSQSFMKENYGSLQIYLDEQHEECLEDYVDDGWTPPCEKLVLEELEHWEENGGNFYRTEIMARPSAEELEQFFVEIDDMFVIYSAYYRGQDREGQYAQVDEYFRSIYVD